MRGSFLSESDSKSKENVFSSEVFAMLGKGRLGIKG
jgi:hypothetical protein